MSETDEGESTQARQPLSSNYISLTSILFGSTAPVACPRTAHGSSTSLNTSRPLAATPQHPQGLSWVEAARNIQMMGYLHWQHCNMPNRLGRTGQWSTASMFPVKHSCALLQNFYTLTSRWLPITSKSSSNISIHLNQAFTLRGLVRKIPGKVQRPHALRFYDAGLTRVLTAIGV